MAITRRKKGSKRLDPKARKETLGVDTSNFIDGIAGGSAQDVANIRYDNWKRRRWPRLGGLITTLSSSPASAKAWATGAKGEQILGARLNKAASERLMVLHDRRIPGSRANIDHIAVTPTGVYVIDAKKYSAQVEARMVGPIFKKTRRLYVGRRDQTKLATGMATQVDTVRAIVDEARIEVQPVLCFVGAEWRLSGPFKVQGVLVIWPRKLVAKLKRPGPLSQTQIKDVYSRLVEGLPAYVKARP